MALRAGNLCLFTILIAAPALAGPPYVTDDPEPTDTGHFEIYAFGDGTSTRDGSGGEAGIDFNYGGAENLQFTAVIPLAYDDPKHGAFVSGLGNIELAAKYRFLHQDDFGWDVSVFPRVFLPSASSKVGDQHASFLLPIWVEKDWGAWSTFGGGGCALNNGGGSKDYCMAGWAVTRQVLPNLHLGLEIYHQTADMRGGRATTGLGAGATWDITDNYHLMASWGPGIQDAAATDRMTWYAALLTTF
ncbi:MAG TPA: transporter [Rhizomicrobium sp.]|jgi:hypothetical protein